jgi:uncharacterized protein (UPF0303 family)
MGKEKLAELERILAEQEEILRFPHFSARDAWELGQFLTERVYERGLELAICIRKLNGAVVFQHMTEGVCLDNQKWMLRKFHTVSLMEKSSLRVWASTRAAGEDVESRGLRRSEYAFCGGGFPIRLKTGELVAVATVSNLPHEQDHAFLAEGLAAYLRKEIPRPDAAYFAE